MTRITQYTVSVIVPKNDDDLELTPAQLRRIGRKMNDAMNRDLEFALYGNYAPAIDPSTVVAEQTPGRRRVKGA